MEKRTPDFKLAVVKALIKDRKVRTTHAARAGDVHLKLTVIDDVLIVSFKEL